MSTTRAQSWALVLVLSGAIFLEGADISMMGVALPSIRDDLGMSTTSLQWVVSAYVLGYGGFVLLGGRIGDLLGRRRTFLTALAVFVAFSGIGGLAEEGWMLVLARFVTGLAAAFMTPVGLSIITTTLPGGREAQPGAARLRRGSPPAASRLGLVLGGLLTGVDWRWVFFAPVVLAALLLAVASRLIPRDVPAARDGGFDLPGAVLLTGDAPAVLGVVRSPDVALGATLAVGGAAVVVLAAFVAVERRAARRSCDSVCCGGGRSRARTPARCSGPALRELPVRRRAVPAGPTRLVADRDRAGAAAGRHRRDPRADLDPADRRALRRGAHRRRRHGARRRGLRAVPADQPGLRVWGRDAADDVLIGLAFTLVYGPLTIVATDGVADEEQGLASGLFNTSFQFGAALGLAVAAAVVAAATGAGDDAQTVLDGYRAGLAVPVAGALLALAVTLPGLTAAGRRGAPIASPHG